MEEAILENEICVHVGAYIRLVNQLDFPCEYIVSLSFPISQYFRNFTVIYEQYKDFPTN